jgi:hypothetical protein
VCGVDYEMDDASLNEVDVDDVVVNLINRAEEVCIEVQGFIVIKAIYRLNYISSLICGRGFWMTSLGRSRETCVVLKRI